MKTGLTIQQMAQELLRQSKAKQDYLVNTGSLSLSVTSDAPQLRVTENGLDKVIAIHGVTPQQIRFETMNSHYCLLAPSSPVAADVPVTVVEQAA